MEILIILTWLIASVVIGQIASKRKLGFGSGFLLSLVLSPVLGILITLASDKVEVDDLVPAAKDEVNWAKLALSKGELDEALSHLQTASAIQPSSAFIAFCQAQVYSRRKSSDLAFQYLQKSVELGKKDLSLLFTLQDLEFLRNQPEFVVFVNNGFRHAPAQSRSSVKISELERIARLRKEGFLTDSEFEAQKVAILND